MRKRTQLSDLDHLTDEQMYKRAKSARDLLFKRKKRLEENVANNPGVYSTHGLKKLQQEIPEVSTKMNRRELKTNLMYLERLKEMDTSTSRGAKKTNKEIIQRMTFGDVLDKMTPNQKKAYNANAKVVQSDPERLSDFWIAFDHYKDQMSWAMLDSKQILKDFSIIFENEANNGYSDIRDIFSKLEAIVDDDYKKQQATNQSALNIGKSGGRFI